MTAPLPIILCGGNPTVVNPAKAAYLPEFEGISPSNKA
jgi:hypothetical protein